MLGACGGGGGGYSGAGIAASASAAPPPAAEAAAPSAPPGPSLADRVAARTKYFGAENVDAKTGEIRSDLVVMSWLTNTTYAAAINGKVVLLDASLMRREQAPGRTPTTLKDMVDIVPAFIVLGGAGPGPADLAANIAFRTGANVIGAQEHCDAVEADARRQQNWSGAAKLLNCTALVPQGQALGKAINAYELPGVGACLRAVKNMDQVSTAADPKLPADSFEWSKGSDLRDPTYWPAGTAANDGAGTSSTASGPRVAYHLTVDANKKFGIFWNDSVGSLKEFAPGVAALMRALPKTDVHVGSVDVGNASANGLRDAAYYIQAIDPKVFFLAGHDAAAQRSGAFNTAELAKRALEFSLGQHRDDAATPTAGQFRPERLRQAALHDVRPCRPCMGARRRPFRPQHL